MEETGESEKEGEREREEPREEEDDGQGVEGHREEVQERELEDTAQVESEGHSQDSLPGQKQRQFVFREVPDAEGQTVGHFGQSLQDTHQEHPAEEEGQGHER